MGKFGVWGRFSFILFGGSFFLLFVQIAHFWLGGGMGVVGILKCEILLGVFFVSLLSGHSSFLFPFPCPFSCLFSRGSGWISLSGFSPVFVPFGTIVSLKYTHTQNKNKSFNSSPRHLLGLAFLSSSWSAACLSSFLPASTLFSVWSFVRFFFSPLSDSIGSFLESLMSFYSFFPASASCRWRYLVCSVSCSFPLAYFGFRPIVLSC